MSIIEAIKQKFDKWRSGPNTYLYGNKTDEQCVPTASASPFASDRERNTPEIAHWHTCRVNRATLGPAFAPHSFICFGTTDQACEQTRVQAEIGCMLEEEYRKLGGNASAVSERWAEEVNVER
jgi:hypothetical protein